MSTTYTWAFDFFISDFFRLKRTNELQHMSSPNHDNLMKHVEKRKKKYSIYLYNILKIN